MAKKQWIFVGSVCLCVCLLFFYQFKDSRWSVQFVLLNQTSTGSFNPLVANERKQTHLKYTTPKVGLAIEKLDEKDTLYECIRSVNRTKSQRPTLGVPIKPTSPAIRPTSKVNPSNIRPTTPLVIKPDSAGKVVYLYSELLL